MCVSDHFGFTDDLTRILWILEYLDDLKCDFSVFHRIDDIDEMESNQFLRYSVRMGAYSGVMASRLARLQEEGGDGQVNGQKPKEIESSRVALSTDPATAGLVSWGGG